MRPFSDQGQGIDEVGNVGIVSSAFHFVSQLLYDGVLLGHLLLASLHDAAESLIKVLEHMDRAGVYHGQGRIGSGSANSAPKRVGPSPSGLYIGFHAGLDNVEHSLRYVPEAVSYLIRGQHAQELMVELHRGNPVGYLELELAPKAGLQAFGGFYVAAGAPQEARNLNRQDAPVEHVGGIQLKPHEDISRRRRSDSNASVSVGRHHRGHKPSRHEIRDVVGHRPKLCRPLNHLLELRNGRQCRFFVRPKGKIDGHVLFDADAFNLLREVRLNFLEQGYRIGEGNEGVLAIPADKRSAEAKRISKALYRQAGHGQRLAKPRVSYLVYALASADVSSARHLIAEVSMAGVRLHYFLERNPYG